MSTTPRKRTSSFSCPAQTKSPRIMGSLRRSESVLHIDADPAPQVPLPFCRTLQHYKEQRLRRKTTSRTGDALNLTIRTTPTSKMKPPAQIILPSASSPITQHISSFRTTSPLSPNPPKPVFPSRPMPNRGRSKHEPDLYKLAIKTNMRSSPGGQKILHMGPRLALSIMSATEELERIVNGNNGGGGGDEDVVMLDCSMTSSTTGMGKALPPVLTTSWVVVRGHDDWEMVDCVG